MHNIQVNKVKPMKIKHILVYHKCLSVYPAVHFNHIATTEVIMKWHNSILIQVLQS